MTVDIGIDNLVLRRPDSSVLRKQMEEHGFELKRGRDDWQIMPRHYKRRDHRVFFRIVRGFLLVNVNVPKLVHGHNAECGRHSEVKTVLGKLRTITGVSWEDCDIQAIDIAFTFESEMSIHEWLNCMQVPNRGRWSTNSQEYGAYWNGRGKTLCCYDKGEHLRSLGNLKYQGLNLIRFEWRFRTGLLRALKDKGLWTHSSLRARDLLADAKGFSSIIELAMRSMLLVLRPLKLSVGIQDILAFDRDGYDDLIASIDRLEPLSRATRQLICQCVDLVSPERIHQVRTAEAINAFYEAVEDSLASSD